MVKVVGLGAQDSFKEAEEFVDRYAARSFPMLWDPTLESWRQLGVTGTPTFAVFDREGRPLEAWVGLLDEDRVLNRVRGTARAGDG